MTKKRYLIGRMARMNGLEFCTKTLIIFAAIFIMKNCFLATSIAISATSPNTDIYPPRIGYASYYSYECAHQPMANGKVFDPEKRTCASWFYNFGTVLIVRSLDTGLTTEVVVTDRGPSKRLVSKGRIIDLSKQAFQDICMLEKGLTRVVIAVKTKAKI